MKIFSFDKLRLFLKKPKESLAKKSFPLVINCRKFRSMAAGIPTNKGVMTCSRCLTREFLLVAIDLNLFIGNFSQAGSFKNENDYTNC